MGCDIHAVIERRTPNGKWVTSNTLSYFAVRREAKEASVHAFPVTTDRNYRRFAALAGVRGDGPKPRGVPDDVSETARYIIDYWGADGHSHSWLPISEALPIFVETEYWSDRDESANEWPRKYPASYFFGLDSDEVNDHRLVFWFDN